MGVFTQVVLIIFLVFATFQFIPVQSKTNPNVDKKYEIKVSKDLKEIFKRSCYDCHSNETKWPWWSYVAPISWSVVNDVIEGRKALNFSEWDRYDKEKKAKLKKSIYRTVAGPMPLPQYTLLHPDAKLSKKDIKKIRYWASDGKGFMKTSVR